MIKKINEIIDVLIKSSWITILILGILFVVIGSWAVATYQVIGTFCTSLGATCLSIAIINGYYEYLKNAKLTANRSEIKKFFSVSPVKWYLPTRTPGNDFQYDLTESLKSNNTKHFYYSGIDMSICAKCIESVMKDVNRDNMIMYFCVPNPMNDKFKGHKPIMEKSVKRIIKSVYGKNIILEFYFLNYIPSFHIQMTDSHCWFAILDKPVNENKRVKYPTTYLFEHDNDMANDVVEFYSTLYKMFDSLKNRHSYNMIMVHDYDIISEGIDVGAEKDWVKSIIAEIKGITGENK